MQIKDKKEKVFDASKLRVGVVYSRFNIEINQKLLDGALKTLSEYKVAEKNITVLDVPGSVELPYTLQALARTKKYDCLVALGSIIRGETDHYDYVCKMAQEGILKVMLDNHIPIGFGILTLNNSQQATTRLDFGAHAARAALELANLRL